MKTIEVDFNNIAHDGKIKVWSDEVARVEIGEQVLLVEHAEDMAETAVLAEVDDDALYFEIGGKPTPAAFSGFLFAVDKASFFFATSERTYGSPSPAYYVAPRTTTTGVTELV